MFTPGKREKQQSNQSCCDQPPVQATTNSISGLGRQTERGVTLEKVLVGNCYEDLGVSGEGTREEEDEASVCLLCKHSD